MPSIFTYLKTLPPHLVLSGFLLLTGSAVTGCRKPHRLPPVTYAAETQRLHEVSHWASPPRGKAVVLSSHDRSGGNRDWADFSERAPENGKKTILEIQGPACISRIWMTGQLRENWEFYFDDEETPRISGLHPRENPKEGSNEWAFQEPLVSVTSGGQTSYVPIPFKQSLKIKVPAGYTPPTPYYQINLQRFPNRTPVESFPAVFTQEDRQVTQTALVAWNTPEIPLAQALSQCTNRQTVTVAPGDTFTWLEQEGPGILQAVSMRLFQDAAQPLSIRQQNNQLRQVRLSLYWDGRDAPSVNAPFGDFFCNAFYPQPFTSLPMGRLDGTFVCRFPMPFSKGARGTLSNESPHPFHLEVGVQTTGEIVGKIRYFHAAWKQDDRMQASKPFPATLLNVTGAGHFAGCYLNVISAEPAWNLLEGDEAFYLDGEAVASLKGTGLEDYFNGAWYYHGLSSRPLSGLLGKAAMNTDQYRWHLGDRIPFQESLKMSMEFGHVLGSPRGPNTSRGYLSATTYYYLEEPVPAPALPGVETRLARSTPMTPLTILPELLEHERAKDFNTAQQRTLAYAEAYQHLPVLSDVLYLRAQRYHERGLVTNVVTFTPRSEPGKKLMQDMASDKMLVHVDTGGAFELTVNGNAVLSGNNALTLHTASIAPTNQVDLVLRLTEPGRVLRPRFRVTLEKDRRLIPVSTDWEFSYGDAWQPYQAKTIYHPQMSSWNLQPNMYAGVQGQGLLMLDKAKYPISPERPLILRTRVTLD